MNCCQDCNQGRACTCAYPLATGQGIKSPESATDTDDMSALDGTEAAIVWLIAIVGAVICLYLIVVSLQFIGV